MTAGLLMASSVSLVGAATASADSVPAQPAYYPSGPQQNVPVSTVTGGGWKLCYQDEYSHGLGSTEVTAVLNACTGPYLMLAGRPNDSTTLTLLAAAPRADVLFEAGTNANPTHIANGSNWYFDDDYSWGFAKAGDSLQRSQCDTASADAQYRLCWHTLSSSVGGYRLGTALGLNGSSAYQRLVYENDPRQQRITFTSTAPTDATVGGDPYDIAASGGASGNDVTFSIDASSKGACALGGATVSFVHPGTCTIDANQAGDDNHDVAPQAQQSFAIGKGAQAITFTSTAPATAFVDGDSYTVAAKGGASANDVTFSIDAASNGACTISGSSVSFVHAGTCTVDANQLGDTDQNAAPQAQQSFTVGRASQAITFTSTPPSTAVVDGDAYTVAATGGASGNDVTFSIDASSKGACSLDGSTVSFVHAGTCTIDANQLGDADHDAAAQAQQSFSVGQGSQAITFTSTAPTNAAVDGDAYTVAATGGDSHNDVIFTADDPDGACTIDGATVSFVHAGTCTIDANQLGDADHDAAAQVQQSFSVGQGSQAITFTSTAPSSALPKGTYDVSATGGASHNVVTYSIADASASVCSVDGSTVTFTHSGSCEVDAAQAGNDDYHAAAPASQTIQVGRLAQTVTFTSTVPGKADSVVGSGYDVAATGTDSGNPVTYSVFFPSAGVCSLTGKHVTFEHPGECIIEADQDGSADYQPADAYQITEVSQAATTTQVSTTANSMSAHVRPVSPGAGRPSGTVTFSIGGTPVGAASITDGVATLAHPVPAGASRTVAALYSGDTDFLGSSDSTARRDPSITATVSSSHGKSRYGWYHSPVTVTFHCAVTSAALTARCPAPVTLRRNAAGQSVTRTISADDGGMSTVSVSGINIDSTKPAVRIGGVRNAASYGGTAPKATCVGADRLAGIASCRLTRTVSGQHVRVTAVATDRAGNASRTHVSYSVLAIYFDGARFEHGAFDVHTGRTYMLVVHGYPNRPVYFDAAVAPQRPAGRDKAFRHGGHHRWVLGVTMTHNLRRYKVWNLGVKIGSTMHVVRVRVR